MADDIFDIDDGGPCEWECFGWFVEDRYDVNARPVCIRAVVIAKDRHDAFNQSSDMFMELDSGKFMNWDVHPISIVPERSTEFRMGIQLKHGRCISGTSMNSTILDVGSSQNDCVRRRRDDRQEIAAIGRMPGEFFPRRAMQKSRSAACE